jgi:hypothetical protein
MHILAVAIFAALALAITAIVCKRAFAKGRIEEASDATKLVFSANRRRRDVKGLSRLMGEE